MLDTDNTATAAVSAGKGDSECIPCDADTTPAAASGQLAAGADFTAKTGCNRCGCGNQCSWTEVVEAGGERVTLPWGCTVSKDGLYMCRSCGKSQRSRKSLDSALSVAGHGKSCRGRQFAQDPAQLAKVFASLKKVKEFPRYNCINFGLAGVEDEHNMLGLANVMYKQTEPVPSVRQTVCTRVSGADGLECARQLAMLMAILQARGKSKTVRPDSTWCHTRRNSGCLERRRHHGRVPASKKSDGDAQRGREAQQKTRSRGNCSGLHC